MATDWEWSDRCRQCGWSLAVHQLPASPTVKRTYAYCPTHYYRPAEVADDWWYRSGITTRGSKSGKVEGQVRHWVTFTFPEATIRAAVASLKTLTRTDRAEVAA